MPRRSRSASSLAWVLTCAVLAVTGMAQMPIFKRYYIADVPGLGWTADFYFTHSLHTLAAAALLLLAGAWLGRRLRPGAGRLTPSGLVRALLLLAVVATGLLRVAKNLHGVWLDPTLVMWVDWTHLGAAALFGLAALWARLRGREPYAASQRAGSPVDVGIPGV